MIFSETLFQGYKAESNGGRHLTADMVRLYQSSKRENFNIQVCYMFPPDHLKVNPYTKTPYCNLINIHSYCVSLKTNCFLTFGHPIP